jgi:hypothetical protein
VGTITFGAIAKAIEATLDDATGIARSADYTQLTEGITDFPYIEVYWESYEVDASGRTDRTALQANVRTWHITFYADVYAAQRGDLAENMTTLVSLVDAIDVVLDQQKTLFFGQAEIRNMRWSARRATLERSGKQYIGARFIIEVWVF